MSCWKKILENFKEDVYVFKLVFGSGIAKYFYFPAIRAVFIFRLSQLFFCNKFTKPISYVLTNINDFLHGIWIGPKVIAGKGLLLSHPRGIIVNPDTIIGDYCSILHQVTFGGDNIIIGNNVEILTDVKIINDKLKDTTLTIGSGTVIGAGSVVLSNIPDNAVVVGVPGKIVNYRDTDDNWVNYRIKHNGDKYV